MEKSRRGTVLVVAIAVLTLALAGWAAVGCGGGTTETTATAAALQTMTTAAAATDATVGGAAGASGAIAVTGLVDNPMTLTVAELEKLGTETVKLQHPKKGEVEYTGVALSKVLEALKVQAAAKSVVIIASDGYTAEVALSDVTADAILAIDAGTISSAFPNLDGQSWVKDIVQMKFQ